MAYLIDSSFTAQLDTMPVGKSKLTVKGEAEVPTGGWSGELVRKNPQGINPTILLLDAKLVAPNKDATQVVSKVPLTYDESPRIAEVSVRRNFL